MSEILKEVAITHPITDEVLFYIRQNTDGTFEFISGCNDVNELSPETKKQMIQNMVHFTNPFYKEVKK